MSNTMKCHIVPIKGGKWQVIKDGETEPESVHDSQSSASQRAQAIIPDEGEVRIHEPEDDNWMLRAAQWAIGTRIAGETPISPYEAARREVPRGLDDMEDEARLAGESAEDRSPSMPRTARTPRDLKRNIRDQDRK